MTPQSSNQRFTNLETCLSKQDTEIAILKEQLASQCKKLDYLISKVDSIEKCLSEKYTRKDDFVFWRNLIITGILLTIFVGIIINTFKS